MQTEQLFRQVADAKFPASLLIQGEDPYLLREWRNHLERAKVELTEVDLKRKAPPANITEENSALSLFSARTLLWIKNPAPPTQWKVENKNVWKKLLAEAHPETNVVILQVPSDKRTKWEALNCEASVRFESDPARKLFWLGYMNERRGNFLGKDKIEFLALLEDEYLLLDNFVELWSLGGDFWASRALGWGGPARRDRPPNLAFAWVDAVVAGDRAQAARYLQTLLVEETQEPLQLMGLLTKSVRILTALEHSWDTSTQPPFLVDRLRARRGRAVELLEKCTQIDTELKSSAVDKFATLLRL